MELRDKAPLIFASYYFTVPNAKIIIMEPFVFPNPPDRAGWREDLDPKIQAVRRMAVDFRCYFIPLDGIFVQAATTKGYEYLAKDGIHPTDEGHKIIAREWLKLYENSIIQGDGSTASS